MTHVFEIEVAEKYGINAAIVLNLLRTWIAYNQANKKNQRDGRTWTYNSVRSWSKLLPYLTAKQVRTALDVLLAAGLVVKCNFNENAYDQTLWYALADETATPCLPGQIAPPSEAILDAPQGNSLDQTNNQSLEPKGGEKTKNELSLEAGRFVIWFISLLVETGAREPKLTDSIRDSWADCYEKMIRIDGRDKKDVASVCRWARNDSFWRGNFMSPMKLRDKKDGVQYFDLFINRMDNPSSNGNQNRNSRSLGVNSNLTAFEEFDRKQLAAGS